MPLAGPITKSELMALASVSSTLAGSKPEKLLDQTRDVLRLKHYSLRTVPRNLDARRAIPFADCLRPACAANLLKWNAPRPRPIQLTSNRFDAIVTAAYDGISGPAGKKRNWDRERSLYCPASKSRACREGHTSGPCRWLFSAARVGSEFSADT